MRCLQALSRHISHHPRFEVQVSLRATAFSIFFFLRHWDQRSHEVTMVEKKKKHTQDRAEGRHVDPRSSPSLRRRWESTSAQ